jgi:hypothetical protein
VRLVTVSLVGLIAIVVGWFGAAHEPSFHGQTRWMVVAVAGFVVMGYSAVSWLMRARSSVLQRRHHLLPLPATFAVPAVDAGLIVVAPVPGRYHRPGCALASGRDWPSLWRADVDLADRSPCGVCRP